MIALRLESLLQSASVSIDFRLLFDLLFALGLGVLLLGRVKETRTLWLLRGYLLLVAFAWAVQRYADLPLTAKLVDALVMACSLALAILWQGELRRLMELLGGAGARQPDRRRRRDSAPLAAGVEPLWHQASGRPWPHRALCPVPGDCGVRGNRHPFAGQPGQAGAADHQ